MTYCNKFQGVLMALTLTCTAGLANASAPLTPHKPILIPGGAGRFDYMIVDNGMRRLYATHKGTKTLAALNLTTETVLPSAKVGGTQGDAVDAKDHALVLGGETGDCILKLNRKSLAIEKTIPTGGPVDAITYDPKNDMVYADHDDHPQIYVVDMKSGSLVKTVAIEGQPEFIEYDPANGMVYQNVKSTNTILQLNTKNDKVSTFASSLPATSPHGLAIDAKHGVLFSAGQNGILSVYSIRTHKQIATAPIAKGVDQIIFDPGTQRCYCACKGFISVVQETRKGAKSLGDVPVPAGSHTLAVDPKTHDVWTTYLTANHSYFLRLSANLK